MLSKFSIRRPFLSVLTVVSLIAVFSSGSIFSRHAVMQSRNISKPTDEALVPDLGIGASLNGARPFPANNAWNMDISRFPVHSNSAKSDCEHRKYDGTAS